MPPIIDAQKPIWSIQFRKEINNNSYPDPVSHCDICQWWPDCDKRRRSDDHLTFVAGIQKAQIKALASHNITTLTALAASRWQLATQQELDSALRRQQNESTGRPKFSWKVACPASLEFEFLPVSLTGRRQQSTPWLSQAAQRLTLTVILFFDIESARHAPGGGLEYLLGYATVTAGQTEPGFEYIWAMDPTG